MDLELCKRVINYVLSNLDVNDMDAVVALITRLSIAKETIEQMKPWDADDFIPILFPAEVADQEEAAANAE